MNKLSWLLYAADALGSFKAVFGLIALAAGISIAVWFAICGVSRIESYDNDDKVGFPHWRLYVICVIAALISSAIPSTTTVYMIAGSEASEVAVKSEIGQKVMAGVEKAIDSYTKKAN